MTPAPITTAMAPEWARSGSADEYDDGDEDESSLDPEDDVNRLPRIRRRRRRQRYSIAH